ncbi:hypothetical protein L1987_16523 [Smallanthus sonchifolius]|uniref:Uncharacterized protein n=1 Tax=Smallanthus sonchifolius TaxID=185202 RepID=A0ACB9J8K6_9ASTR|nr:hypothetical protein L1987_16523 [Smallanthus sonchifolius]
MGNCQAVDAAALVIQHPNGRIERMYWSITASEVMKINPGHYVSIIIPLPPGDGEDDKTVRFTRVKLLRPSDTLVLGRAYRLVTTHEVMKVVRAKKHAKMKNKSDKESSSGDLETTIEVRFALITPLDYASLRTIHSFTESNPSKKSSGLENNGFFVVRKGDLVGVYNNLTDCQAQVGSSVCDPPVSVTMPKESEAYLLSRGLKNALYSIRAVDLTEELFRTLVPCPFNILMNMTNLKEYISKFWGRKLGLREGLGVATNNVAEYRAMILGLRYALSKDSRTMEGEESEYNQVDKNSEADAQANLAVLLAVGEVQEEEVEIGEIEGQSQQSVVVSS